MRNISPGHNKGGNANIHDNPPWSWNLGAGYITKKTHSVTISSLLQCILLIMLMDKLVIILQSWLPLPFTFKTILSPLLQFISVQIMTRREPVEWDGVLLQTWPLNELGTLHLTSNCQPMFMCRGLPTGPPAGEQRTRLRCWCCCVCSVWVRRSAVCGEV